MINLDVNTDALVLYSNKLERASRSALPSAVRETLSKTALDVKKRSMIIESDKAFVKRRPAFFRAKTTVDFAKGYNVNTMRSAVGFIDDGKQATENMEIQERGGTIGGRSYINVDSSRVSKKNEKSVRKKNRLSTISKPVDTLKQKGSSLNQKQLAAAYKAGVNGYILGKEIGGKQFLLRITDLNKSKFGSEVIASYVKGRSVKPKKAKHFAKKAALSSSRHMDRIFQVESMRQFKRIGLL